jgi:transposase
MHGRSFNATSVAGLGPDGGRAEIDPKLMMRMLIMGYCFEIRPGGTLCAEIHLNLACC